MSGCVRLAGLGVRLGIARGVEGGDRDLVHAQVVGVAVAALVLGVADDHLRADPADDRDEATDGLVERRLVEALGVFVGRRVRHPRVAVAEHHDLVEADDPGRLLELAHAHRADVGPHVGRSIAGFKMSPSSPPVQVTSTVCTPSAW